MTLIELLVAILFIDFLFAIICGIASIWVPALSLFNLKVLVFCLTVGPVFIFAYLFVYITFFFSSEDKNNESNSNYEENTLEEEEDTLEEIYLKEIGRLIDKFFSTKWCRDNLIVPIAVNESNKKGLVKLAITDSSNLGNLENLIIKRLSKKGYNCEFIEQSPEEIKKIIEYLEEINDKKPL